MAKEHFLLLSKLLTEYQQAIPFAQSMSGDIEKLLKNEDLTKKEATKIVIKNLKKIPNYYTNFKLSGIEGTEPEYIGGK